MYLIKYSYATDFTMCGFSEQLVESYNVFLSRIIEGSPPGTTSLCDVLSPDDPASEKALAQVERTIQGFHGQLLALHSVVKSGTKTDASVEATFAGTSFSNLFLKPSCLILAIINDSTLHTLPDVDGTIITQVSSRRGQDLETQFDIEGQSIRGLLSSIVRSADDLGPLENAHEQLKQTHSVVLADLASAKKHIESLEGTVSRASTQTVTTDQLNLLAEIKKYQTIEARLIKENDALLETLDAMETKAGENVRMNVATPCKVDFSSWYCMIKSWRGIGSKMIVDSLIPLPSDKCVRNAAIHARQSSKSLNELRHRKATKKVVSMSISISVPSRKT